MSTFHGDWEKTPKKMEALAKLITKNLKLANAQNLQVTRAVLVKHIQNQDLKWQKLKPQYVEQKKKKRLSTHILIATSEMMQSITTKVASNKMSGFVGVNRTAKRKDGQKTFLVAKIHEFGSKKRGIPKRPLFQPTFRQTKRKAISRYKKAIKKALDKIGD